MPDAEMFKIILNGGSFGLLAIGVVWALFWGAPMLRDTLREISTQHTTAVTTMTTSCTHEAGEIRDWVSEEMKRRDDAILRLAQAVEKLADRQ